MSKVRFEDPRTRPAIVAAGFLFIALLAASTWVNRRHVVFNATPSLPEGFYRLRHTRAQTGDLIWFHAPPRMHRLAISRRYLPSGAHFAKRVIGEAGTLWCIREDRFVVDSSVYGPVFREDSEGRPLPRQRGCHIVPDGEVLVGTPHRHSIDSRYFGSISRKRIRGTLTPLWTWPSRSKSQTK